VLHFYRSTAINDNTYDITKIITYFTQTPAYDKIKLIIIGTNVICLSVFLILGVLGHLGVRYTKIVFFKTKTFLVTERTSISIVFDLLYSQMFILYPLLYSTVIFY